MNLELYLITSSSECEISRVVSRDFGVIIYHISPLQYCSLLSALHFFVYLPHGYMGQMYPTDDIPVTY